MEKNSKTEGAKEKEKKKNTAQKPFFFSMFFFISRSGRSSIWQESPRRTGRQDIKGNYI